MLSHTDTGEYSDTGADPNVIGDCDWSRLAVGVAYRNRWVRVAVFG